MLIGSSVTYVFKKNELIIAYCCILANKTIQNMEGKLYKTRGVVH